MKKGKWFLLSLFIVSLIFLVSATVQRLEQTVNMTAVDSSPLTGTTTARTYQAADRTAAYCVTLDEEIDKVVITADGTGSDGNSAVFNLYGYGLDGGAERIYHTVTAILGTAVAGTDRLYVEQFSGTDTHCTSITILDSGAGGNTRAKIYLETHGLRYLMFEPTTFTSLTSITFHVRGIGSK
jgi:hypothetical protein